MSYISVYQSDEEVVHEHRSFAFICLFNSINQSKLIKQTKSLLLDCDRHFQIFCYKVS